MPKKIFLHIALAVIVVFFTGCASIIHGTSQEVSFNSNPEEVTVTINGKVIGKTPLTTSLKKKSGQTILFEKEGYKPISMQLETRMDSWFWGNIVLGGFIGSTTDGLSGAVNEYSPSQYMVTLSPASTSSIESPTSVSNRQRVKDFIVVGYKEIVSEVYQGQGQYLSSLFSLMNITADKQNEAVLKLQSLSEEYANIPDFADHVVSTFM